METTWDKLRAVVFAVGLHLLLIGLLFIGLSRPITASADAEGPIIQATLVSSPQQSAAIAKAIKALDQRTAQDTPPPLPSRPEPKQQDAPPQQLAPQAPLPKPDTVDQEEIRRVAEKAAEQKKLQEQEARAKQKQIDLTNKQQQQLAVQELQRQKQLDDLRKLRAEEARKANIAAQRMKQDHDQLAQLALNNTPPTAVPNPLPHLPSGNNGAKQDPNAKYLKAIKDALDENWHRTVVPEGVHCHVQFIQERPSGEVKDVIFGDCQYDAAARESVEALKGILLPYKNFESVFQPVVNIDMCYPQEACVK